MDLNTLNGGAAPSTTKKSPTFGKHLNPDIAITLDAEQLTEDEFVKLSKASGEEENVQGATNDPKRLPFMAKPQPVVVTARDKDGHLVGAVQGVNFGEYAYMDTAMVDKKHQGTGLGTKLADTFQKKVIAETGGDTSIMTLSEDPDDLNTPSHQFWTKRGFKPLPNALVLRRGETIQGAGDKSDS
jgi:GNAT superfamily N-acetyltransferase